MLKYRLLFTRGYYGFGKGLLVKWPQHALVFDILYSFKNANTAIVY